MAPGECCGGCKVADGRTCAASLRAPDLAMNLMALRRLPEPPPAGKTECGAPELQGGREGEG